MEFFLIQFIILGRPSLGSAHIDGDLYLNPKLKLTMKPPIWGGPSSSSPLRAHLISTIISVHLNRTNAVDPTVKTPCPHESSQHQELQSSIKLATQVPKSLVGVLFIHSSNFLKRMLLRCAFS